MPLQPNRPVFYLFEGNTYTEGMIRNAYPNVSFATPFVPPEGYEPVFHVGYPEYDTMTQYLMEIDPVNVNGQWQQAYTVMSLSPEQIAANQLEADRRTNAAIKQQIATLEEGQERAVREAALGQPERLTEIEASIQALRNQFIRDEDGNVI